MPPSTTGPYAEQLNTVPKYVFPATLDRPEWRNTTVVRGDVADQVSALEREPGKDLVVYGHGRFGQTLCDAGLVDELTLTVFPGVRPGRAHPAPAGRNRPAVGAGRRRPRW